jgi:hypothetical protein
MPLLLRYSPKCCFPLQALSVCIHKSPGSVDKAPDDVDWAGIEGIDGSLLSIIERPLWYLTIPIFEPSPVLRENEN